MSSERSARHFKDDDAKRLNEPALVPKRAETQQSDIHRSVGEIIVNRAY